MKKIGILLTAIGLIIFGCKKTENLDREIVGLGGDTWPTTPLDTWLYDTFTKPYNIAVKYRWDGTEQDPNFTLVPPKTENVKPLMEMVNNAWINPYVDLMGANFIKTYAPKNYVLIGSVRYNSGGTVTLGEAGGGVKITLFNVNNYDATNRAVSKRILKTIHHEFAHILHQTTMFQKEYQYITPSGYTADWNNATGFYNKGFISQYAQAAPEEDFVEMIALMITEGRNGYEVLTRNITDATALAAVRQKQSMVTAYLKQTWNVEIESIQAKVQAAINQRAPENAGDYFAFGTDKLPILTVNPIAEPISSTSFSTIYDNTVSGLAAVGGAGRILDQFALIRTSATQMTLRLYYRNTAGSAFTADFVYNVTNNANGTFSLTYVSRDANADVIAAGVTSLTNFLVGGRQFGVKYYYNANNTKQYTGIYDFNNQDTYLYGFLSY
jgi:substrate import-associated zinc metallohydrolase lipoprotein